MPESFSIRAPAAEDVFAQVVFKKLADRWSHRFELITPGKSVLVATSIEGTPDNDWPPSQPLQEISQTDLNGQHVLLGVGMAGRSHWSLSCSHEPDANDGTESILIELACLVKAPRAGWLGSSYQLGPDVTVRTGNDDGNDKLLLTMDNNHAICMSTRKCQGTGENWATRFQIADRELQIRPAVISSRPTMSTRWAFAVEVEKKPLRND